MDSNEIKQQAQYIWNRLDDLAANDPSAYKKFIDEQMKERQLFKSVPEPKLCVLVKIKEKKSNNLYINICGWKRIPYPADDQEALKLMSGVQCQQNNPEDMSFITVPVAANDKVLDELLQSPADKIELIKLILQFVSQQLKINIEERFEICKELYKGIFPANPRGLFVNESNDEFSEADVKKLISREGTSEVMSTPKRLIEKLSAEDVDEKLIETLPASDTKRLIQEVNSNADEKNWNEPEYNLSDDERGNFVLKVRLPLVRGAAECDLDITPDSVELTAPAMYRLEISLPDKIEEKQSCAKFNKKSSVLTVVMPKLTKRCYELQEQSAARGLHNT